MEVEAQKGGAHTDDGSCQSCGLQPVRLRGKQQQADGSDARDAGRKPIKAIDQVDYVGEPNDVDERDWRCEKSKRHEPSAERVPDVGDFESRCDCDCGRHDLTEKLDTRRERQEVIRKAHEEDHGHGHQHPEHP